MPASDLLNALPWIEAHRSIRILFAVESGSRAWGFESRDSDYDVRFVYLSPLDEYLTICPRRDVIEDKDFPEHSPLFDYSGWDFRKMLGLISKSNPVVYEWLQSPLIYREESIWQEVRTISASFFSPKAAMHHYLSMARHNYREHIRDGAASKVKLKKYLYITRPLLCCRWIELNPDKGPPPMPFRDVLHAAQVEKDVESALIELMDRKRAGEELDEGTAVPAINRFIDTELWRLKMVADSMPVGKGDVRVLDELFARFATHIPEIET